MSRKVIGVKIWGPRKLRPYSEASWTIVAILIFIVLALICWKWWCSGWFCAYQWQYIAHLPLIRYLLELWVKNTLLRHSLESIIKSLEIEGYKTEQDSQSGCDCSANISLYFKIKKQDLFSGANSKKSKRKIQWWWFIWGLSVWWAGLGWMATSTGLYRSQGWGQNWPISTTSMCVSWLGWETLQVPVLQEFRFLHGRKFIFWRISEYIASPIKRICEWCIS